MNGAIFYAGQQGSTAQYADWIGEATGLPVFNVNDTNADPSEYDYLILGSSVIVYKLTIRKWIRANLKAIEGKPTILFTVSGAPTGEKLDGWISYSLPKKLGLKDKPLRTGWKIESGDTRLVDKTDSQNWRMEE